MKHRDMGSRQNAAAPPNRHNRYSRKTLNRPLCFYVRPSRPSWTFPGPHSAMCHGAPGHEPFYQRFLFDRPGGPTRQVPRYAYGGLSCLLAVASKLSSVCLALTPSRRHRGVDRQKVADIAAWGAHRRPMPGGRLVRMDCSSACCSLRLFERTGYLFVRARGPCRPGTAYVTRPVDMKKPPGEEVPFFLLSTSPCCPDLRVWIKWSCQMACGLSV